MKQCLVVDDSRVIRKVAASIVSQYGFTGVEAEDAAGALSACRERMPDLVLLDWNIPGSNVLDFVRTLRREAGGDAPHVVFCTTANDVERIQEALAAGADDYVLKPFDAPSLGERLTDAGMI